MEIAPGTMVTPNVRLVRLLGEGGMGSVWVARHLSLETDVAVKFISSELSQDDPEILARFRREAKIAARIKSQHVVQVFDHGVTEDGTPFIVMEMLEGSSLAEWLALEGALSLEETAEIVAQVAGVLAKAHDLGVVHRDIKPENIFLVDSEERTFAKVLDFGIAKQTRLPTGSLKTGTGIIIGTPDYMSPEQLLRAGGVDHRADLWALAVVAYRAVAGVGPFLGETLPGIIVAITEGSFERPSLLAPQPLPRGLDDWFDRALARDPERRFGSARELSDSFRKACREAPQAAPQAAEKPAPPQVVAEARAARGRTKHRLGAAATVRDAPKAAAPPTRAGLDPSERLGQQGPERRRVPARRAAPAAPTRAGLGPADRAADGGRERRRQPARGTPPTRRQPAPPAPKPRRAEPAPQQPRGRVRPASAERDGSPAWASRFGEGLELAEPARGRLVQPAHAARAGPAALSAAAPVRVADMAWPALIMLAVLVVIPLLEPSGVAAVRRMLGAADYLAYGVATALMALGGWRLGAHGKRAGSLLLYLSALGLWALAATSALTAAVLAAPTSSAAAFRDLTPLVAPVASAAVALGLGGFGLLRTRDELLGPARRPSYGVILLIASLLGIGIAYRLLRGTELLRGLLG